MVTEDGYPDDKDLLYIETYDCLKCDVRVLLDFIEDIWWTPDWGFKRTSGASAFKEFGIGDKDDLMIELHTGGWSGNEDIIRALKRNQQFYLFYWDMSRVGGHEYFRFTELSSWKA